MLSTLICSGPLPAQIGQADSQKMLFEGSHLAPAAYPVKKQTTKVRPEAVTAAILSSVPGSSRHVS